MQTTAGLQVASLLDPDHYDVTLYHEDWHGPYDVGRTAGVDIVFLTGLQADFDRMRQLSCVFRRAGATVVAGGSIATLYPEFCTRFFDVVCAGGVECAAEVGRDFLAGRLRPIYRSPIAAIGGHDVDYAHFTRNGIRVQVHLIESSRGCSFRCSFCVIPGEVGAHAPHKLDWLRRTLDNAIATSPRFSWRRAFPIVMLQDNNFSDDRAHALAVAELFRTHPKVRGWMALVTQNALRDEELMRTFAASKCRGLFVGLESLDTEFLRRFQKKQNLGRDGAIDLVARTEKLGVPITYGYLLDPRYQTVAQMREQLRTIAATDALSMPVYLSLVSPLLGTGAFEEEAREGRLAPNLRLRDLDGETIAYRQLADDPDAVSAFVDELFRHPLRVVGLRAILRKVIRRIFFSGSRSPIDWYIRVASSLHCFAWAFAYPSRRQTYRAGENVLDPQYETLPADLTEAERELYLTPIAITGADGQPLPWVMRERAPMAVAAE